MKNQNTRSNSMGFNFIGWKTYNQIRKKAIDKEFSWSGLLLSLSVAFFIVFLSATILNISYQSIERAKKHQKFIQKKIYLLESGKRPISKNQNYLI